MATQSRNWPEFPLHGSDPDRRRAGPWAVSVLAFCAVVVIAVLGFSRALERSNPELARRLFPLNLEAVLHHAASLMREQPDADLAPLEPAARTLVPTHAGDPRLYSLIGQIRQRAGDPEAAAIAFDQAFALSKTEITALQWTLQRVLDQGDFPAALDRLDVLFRRWPGQVAPLAPVVLGASAKPEYYLQLLDRLKADPPWRGPLLGVLARNPDALALTTRLMQDLAAGPTPPRSGELAPVLARLLAAGQPDLAYRTFILTLSPAERAVAGYVYNGRFLLPPTDRPFDWQIRRHPGMTATLRSQDEAAAGGGLRMRFSNIPVRNLSVFQAIALPPGTYELEFTAAATDARLPKELLWRIVCSGSNQIVAEAPVSPGTYKATPSRTEFTIPDAACPLQTLQLVTKAMVDNWNERYSGTVIFDDFRISAAD